LLHNKYFIFDVLNFLKKKECAVNYCTGHRMRVSRHDVPLLSVRMQTSHAERNFTFHVKLIQGNSQ